MSKIEKFTSPHPLNTAVLFLIFNRLDTTQEVFKAIRQAKPPRLYIAADGARESKDGEEAKVQAVREYIISNIDWECEVKTLFREKNHGCKIAVSGAIDWFFANEEMGIILEDDCLPSQSFFWFCEELLERYKSSDDIYLISGDGRGTGKIEINGSYSFVKYPMIWGWASWSRVWKKYDVTINDWESNKHKIIQNISKYSATKRYWKTIFQSVYEGKIDTWDYQFSYLLQKNKAKCIVPNVNLISNIGFGENATHTFDKNSENANLENFDIKFPLIHPSNILNDKLNSFYDLNEFQRKSLTVRAINKLSRLVWKQNLIK